MNNLKNKHPLTQEICKLSNKHNETRFFVKQKYICNVQRSSSNVERLTASFVASFLHHTCFTIVYRLIKGDVALFFPKL